MTRKLFWDDPYLTTLATDVTSVGGGDVSVADTIFFVFSGGQESDHGTIGGRDVLAAHHDEESLCYTLGAGHGLAVGDAVYIEIDAIRRAALRRLHMAAEIVLELLTQDDPGLRRIGAHIAQDKARIDFESAVALGERLPRIAAVANEVIEADHTIVTAFGDATRQRRYWEISGFARVPCGGTLPRSTGEIGRLMLRRKNPGKGKERVEITLAPGS